MNSQSATSPTPIDESSSSGSADNKEMGIEIEWTIPDEPIEQYHIRFGPLPSQLNYEKVVLVSDLEKRTDSQGQSVYRYVLRGFNQEEVAYISLQAENKMGISPPTEPIAIKGDK